MIPAVVPSLPAPNATKGSVYIGKIVDKRTGPQPYYTITMGINRFEFSTDESSETTVANLLKEAFKRRGYAIVNDPANALVVTATLDSFVGAGTPATWSLSLEARIKTTVSITKAGVPQTIEVEGYGKNVCQLANAANVNLVLVRLYGDYLQNIDRELDRVGL